MRRKKTVIISLSKEQDINAKLSAICKQDRHTRIENCIGGVAPPFESSVTSIWYFVYFVSNYKRILTRHTIVIIVILYIKVRVNPALRLKIDPIYDNGQRQRLTSTHSHPPHVHCSHFLQRK